MQKKLAAQYVWPNYVVNPVASTFSYNKQLIV